MPTTISPPTTLKSIQKEKKLYNWFKNQSAQIQQRKHAHSAQNAQAKHNPQVHNVRKRDIVYKKIHALL
jgi:hypothetical protein